MEFRYCPLCAAALEPGMHGGKERLACPSPSCTFVHWNNPTPVVAAVVEHEGDVILVRNHGWPAKWHGLVSGFLERDETPEDGILREIKEEIHLDGTVEAWIGNYEFPMMNQIILAYHVRAHGTIELGEEIASFKRIPPDKLRAWPMGTGKAVQAWLDARQNS